MINQTGHGKHVASWQGFASPSGTSSHGAPEHSLAHGPARLFAGFLRIFQKEEKLAVSRSKVSTSTMESTIISYKDSYQTTGFHGFYKKIGHVSFACV